MAEAPGREPDAPERQLSRTELLLHRANSLESELERLHHLLEQQLDVVGRGIAATQNLQAKLATEDYTEEEGTAELEGVQKELDKQYADLLCRKHSAAAPIHHLLPCPDIFVPCSRAFSQVAK